MLHASRPLQKRGRVSSQPASDGDRSDRRPSLSQSTGSTPQFGHSGYPVGLEVTSSYPSGSGSYRVPKGGQSSASGAGSRSSEAIRQKSQHEEEVAKAVASAVEAATEGRGTALRPQRSSSVRQLVSPPSNSNAGQRHPVLDSLRSENPQQVQSVSPRKAVGSAALDAARKSKKKERTLPQRTSALVERSADSGSPSIVQRLKDEAEAKDQEIAELRALCSAQADHLANLECQANQFYQFRSESSHETESLKSRMAMLESLLPRSDKQTRVERPEDMVSSTSQSVPSPELPRFASSPQVSPPQSERVPLVVRNLRESTPQRLAPFEEVYDHSHVSPRAEVRCTMTPPRLRSSISPSPQTRPTLSPDRTPGDESSQLTVLTTSMSRDTSRPPRGRFASVDASLTAASGASGQYQAFDSPAALIRSPSSGALPSAPSAVMATITGAAPPKVVRAALSPRQSGSMRNLLRLSSSEINLGHLAHSGVKPSSVTSAGASLPNTWRGGPAASTGIYSPRRAGIPNTALIGVADARASVIATQLSHGARASFGLAPGPLTTRQYIGTVPATAATVRTASPPRVAQASPMGVRSSQVNR